MHVIPARVSLHQAILHPLSKEETFASLMFSITLGTASFEQVLARVLLSASLRSRHLGKGVAEGGTQGVFDSSSIFISGE